MNRTYARSFASLACVLVALASWSSSALDLWALRQSTLPSIDALRPLDAKHTWRFVQPMVAEGTNAAFVESRISGLVSDAVVLQESWRAYAEGRASRVQWELAAWSIVLVCSALLFAFRAEGASAA
jgi:hypothetical protein